jgi:hypothetical protein
MTLASNADAGFLHCRWEYSQLNELLGRDLLKTMILPTRELRPTKRIGPESGRIILPGKNTQHCIRLDPSQPDWLLFDLLRHDLSHAKNCQIQRFDFGSDRRKWPMPRSYIAALLLGGMIAADLAV